MKIQTIMLRCAFFAILLLAIEVDADELDTYVTYQTKSTNGVEMGVRVSGTHGTNQTGQKILLFFRMPKDRQGLVLVPKIEFIGNVTLHNSKPNAIRKTSFGQTFGSKSGKLRWEKGLCTDHRKNLQMVAAYDFWHGSFELPSVSDLFEIDNPGEYILALDLQVLLEEKGRREIVFFPRVEIPVTRLRFEPTLPYPIK